MELASNVTNLFIFFLTCFLGVLSWLHQRETNRSDNFELIQKDHEKRIQKMEDVHGPKFETLEKKIDKLEISIQNLSENLHKEKNQEHTLTIAITKLYEHLEKVQKNEKHN